MARGDGTYREWAECKRKTRFDTEHRAVRRGTQLGLRAYECPHCKGWHLTHMRLSANQANIKMPAPHPQPSNIKLLEMRVFEARRILEKLLERKKAGVELPKSAIENAQERLDDAEGAYEDARATARVPAHAAALESQIIAARRRLDTLLEQERRGKPMVHDAIANARARLADAQDALDALLCSDE